jgi:hypothetical protein
MEIGSRKLERNRRISSILQLRQLLLVFLHQASIGLIFFLLAGKKRTFEEIKKNIKMKKRYILGLLCWFTSHLVAQNALLVNPFVGNPIATGEITDFELVYDGVDQVLVIGNRTSGELCAIDYNSATSAGVHDWESNQVDNVLQKVADATGNTTSNLQVRDMAVNPKTKSVVLLMFATNLATSFLVEVKSQTDLKIMDISNVSYAAMIYTQNNNYIFDIEWGDDNRLYFCTGDYTLDAEVGAVTPPFVHTTNLASRATTVFKSNWGGSYFTEAPLERISMAKVDGVGRLMGVTTCAPGFSIPTTEIDGSSSLLTVTEDFNVRFDPSLKVVALNQEVGGTTKAVLFDLHWNAKTNATQLISIGQKYLDDSRLAAGETNGNAQLIRTAASTITPGLSEEEAREWVTGFTMIAKYDEYRLMVIDDKGALRLMDVSTTGVGIVDNNQFREMTVFPVPANDILYVQGVSTDELRYTITTIDGKHIEEGSLTGKLNTQHLANGHYLLSIKEENGKQASQRFQINR